MQKRQNKILAILLVALCIGTLVNYAFYALPSISGRFSNIVYDTWLRLRTPHAASPEILIVDIDEQSLKEIGQLPWPRSILADLVEQLLAGGAKTIGLDLWLSEPDRSSPIAVGSLLEKNFDLNLDLSGIPPLAQDNDRYFSEIIAHKPVIIGALATGEKEAASSASLPKPVSITPQTDSEALKFIPELPGMNPPLERFSAIAPVGLLNVSLDDDGIVREMPLLYRIDNRLYATLSLLALMQAKGAHELDLESSPTGISAIQVGDVSIPVEKNALFRPVYRGGDHAFPYIPARDILNGKVPRERLAGKTLFIGISAHTVNSLASTPLDPNVTRAEIHATLLDNFLNGVHIRAPNYVHAIQICLTYFSALVSSAAFILLSLPVYAALAILLLVSFIGGSWLIFQEGIFLSPMGSVTALLLSGALIIPFRYWHEQKERSRLKLAFNKYVSPEVVSRILTEGDELLQGRQIDATVMFTDVRNFTSISEHLAPEQLVRLLNRYFTPMTACVTRRNGTLDKFIGDALMAFWNAPLEVENHSLQATLAALEMQQALARLRPDMLREFKIEMRMGIGINLGPVHVGNMGSDELMNYTVIGETVNLASRLEGMCKTYGMGIIVSETIKEACAGELDFLLLDKIRVKGSSRPLHIYAPLSGELVLPPETVSKWNEALDFYFSGDFASALAAFTSLAEYAESAALKTAATLFRERCRNFSLTAPAGWDGVWNYQTK